MLICRNAEGAKGQRKVGNPRFRLSSRVRDFLVVPPSILQSSFSVWLWRHIRRGI